MERDEQKKISLESSQGSEDGRRYVDPPRRCVDSWIVRGKGNEKTARSQRPLAGYVGRRLVSVGEVSRKVAAGCRLRLGWVMVVRVSFDNPLGPRNISIDIPPAMDRLCRTQDPVRAHPQSHAWSFGSHDSSCHRSDRTQQLQSFYSRLHRRTVISRSPPGARTNHYRVIGDSAWLDGTRPGSHSYFLLLLHSLC